MSRFAVLLRGVNVGAGGRLQMAALRSLLESLGYTDVKTLLNSGNAVFTSRAAAPARHARAIHDVLHEQLGLDVATIVVTAEQCEAIVADNVLAPHCEHPSRLLVVFAIDAVTLAGLVPLGGQLRPGERFTIGRHAAYLYCPDGILESPAGAALLGKAGRAVTTRNWSTVNKLAALLRDGERSRRTASGAARRPDRGRAHRTTSR
jgi:uncharacterized protein (DUF1697 family)